MIAFRRIFSDLLADEQGSSAVEYGLIAGLIVIGLLAGITGVAEANNQKYKLLEDELAV